MVTLIARKDFTYARRAVRVGETVEVDDRLAIALVATKRAVRADVAAAPTPRPTPAPRPAPTPPVPAPPARPPVEDDPPAGDNGETTEDEAPVPAPAEPVEDAGLRTQRAAATMRRPPTRRTRVGR